MYIHLEQNKYLTCYGQVNKQLFQQLYSSPKRKKSECFPAIISVPKVHSLPRRVKQRFAEPIEVYFVESSYFNSKLNCLFYTFRATCILFHLHKSPNSRAWQWTEQKPPKKKTDFCQHQTYQKIILAFFLRDRRNNYTWYPIWSSSLTTVVTLF